MSGNGYIQQMHEQALAALVAEAAEADRLALEEIIEDHRQQFGGPDTVRALTSLYGYSKPAARALVKRLKRRCAA